MLCSRALPLQCVWGVTAVRRAQIEPTHYIDLLPVFALDEERGRTSFGLVNMCTEPNGRDPFRVVVGFIDDSDVLVKAALAGGPNLRSRTH